MDLIFLITFAVTWIHAALTSEVLKQVGLKYYNTSHRVSTVKQCGDKIITERQGKLTSPNYPQSYPNPISCSWHISGKEGEVITIVFHDLDIEDSGTCEYPPCCVFNWLKISTSFNATDHQFCGQDSTYHPIFISTTNKVWVKFHVSTVRKAGRGFNLSFSIGPKPRRPSCNEDDFRCNNGVCVSQNARCNGVSECVDDSDEQFCSAFCPTGRSCRSFLFCYDEKKHCDGIADCNDLSDEMGCSPCTANETRCGSDSYECYNPVTQSCNRITDCTNGIDEKDCQHTCPGKITCSSGIGCYMPEERCNGISQCSDSSDEKNCDADLCNYERGGFLCGNGHCIREMWKCDRTNDCGDGTDEYNCLRNSVLTAAITGSLICALLLVIAISCTCRLYALRALENHMTNRESAMSRMSPEFLFREPPPSYAVAVGEHQRNLYVENVHHYNPCPRRGRRRIRRARRYPDGRRGSVSLLDNMVHQNRPLRGPPPLNFPFPCLPVSATTRSPSPEMSHTSSSNVSSTTTGVSVVSSSEADCCWDTDQNPSEGAPNVSGDMNMDLDKEKQDGGNRSTNAESSFSELPTVHKTPKCNTPHHQESSHYQNISSILLVPNDLTSFHTERSTVLLNDPCETVVTESENTQHTNSNSCDNDTQPLIT